MGSSATDIPLITLEEHFTATATVSVHGEPTSTFGPKIGAKLIELGQPRIDDMNSAGVAKQVLSHTPFPSAPDPQLCVEINDELKRAVDQHPDRFVGFATLPMHKPKEAAEELERSVTALKFVGALVDTHIEGIWYDGSEYDIFWQKACELDVAIYLHPCFASEQMLAVNYRGNYPEEVAQNLGAFVFGWHTETGLHFLRLLAAGVFDRFPTLKICLGHMGEMIPYLFERQERSTGRWTHIKRPLREVWQKNVWVTTSGTFDTAPLRCVLKISPLDHVMLSIDYPFSDTTQGRTFIETIEKEGILSRADLEAFANGNAAKLLKLKDPGIDHLTQMSKTGFVVSIAGAPWSAVERLYSLDEGPGRLAVY